MPLERDINITVNGPSWVEVANPEHPFTAMLISRSRGTYLIEMHRGEPNRNLISTKSRLVCRRCWSARESAAPWWTPWRRRPRGPPSSGRRSEHRNESPHPGRELGQLSRLRSTPWPLTEKVGGIRWRHWSIYRGGMPTQLAPRKLMSEWTLVYRSIWDAKME